MEILTNQNILLYLFGYLFTSIPFGYLLAKQFAGVDIQQAGSGNIGATNVLRVVKEQDPALAKKLSAVTLLLDATKGVIVMLIAMLLNAPDSTLWTLAVISVIGHCFSAFLGFEGGKGVATAFGVLLLMMPLPALIAIAAWLIAGKGLKISSLSSLAGLIVFVPASYLIHPEVQGIGSHAPVWIISMIVLYKHIPNIERLIKREESTI